MTSERPDFLPIPNGDKSTLPFSHEEYERRLSALRAVMKQRSVSAVLRPMIRL